MFFSDCFDNHAEYGLFVIVGWTICKPILILQSLSCLRTRRSSWNDTVRKPLMTAKSKQLRVKVMRLNQAVASIYSLHLRKLKKNKCENSTSVKIWENLIKFKSLSKRRPSKTETKIMAKHNRTLKLIRRNRSFKCLRWTMICRVLPLLT